jgi:hypothetical protein
MSFRDMTLLILAAGSVSRGGQTAVSDPPPLPGKGLAQHPFLYCGEWQRRSTSDQTMYIVREGKIAWSYTNPLKRAGRLQQLIEVTPDKQVAWALRDWTTLGPASLTQLLDQAGTADKRELQR